MLVFLLGKKRGGRRGGRCGGRGGKRGWKRHVEGDAESESDLSGGRWGGRGGMRGGMRGCKRGWRRFAEDVEVESEVNEKEFNNSGRCGWRGGCERGRFNRKFFEECESASESKSVDSTLSREEIKMQIAALVESKKVLVAQMREVASKVFQKREEFRECRENPVFQGMIGERIAVLRAEMFELKAERCLIKKSVCETKREIRDLKILAKNKN